MLAKRRKENLDKQTVDLGKVIEVFDKNTNKRKTYPSIHKVAYRLGTTRTTIRSYITNGKALATQRKSLLLKILFCSAQVVNNRKFI